MRFAAGENVGPYRIVEQLGQGGMATVFKAYHPALDRYVAIKALHPAFMEDPNFLARFQREARVVAKLEHEHIVPIYDYAEHAGRPYLVMKFIEGETLKAHLRKSRLTKEKILKIMEAIGAALGYAHDRGVLHRDIKPSNVLITPEGRIYLADFGLARIAEAGQSTLSSDMMLGTPHYISPEQARGEIDLDAGTDIYSLGIVLYELCVGKVPFTSDTPFSIIHDHIYTPLPLPRSINPNVPEDIERVLLKALAKDRNVRYQGVQEFVIQFEAALMGRGVELAQQEELIAAATTVPAEPLLDAVEVFPGMEEPDRDTLNELGQSKVATRMLEQPRRPRKWAWILGGIGITLFFLFAFMIAVGDSAEAGTVEYADPSANVESLTAPEVEGDIKDEITIAQEDVDRKPDNPEARLRLAERLFEAGYPRAALLEVYKAADLFLQGGDYLNAGKALVRAVEESEGQIAAEGRLNTLLPQVLFLGAQDPAMEEVFDSLLMLKPDWETLSGLWGHYLLLQGREKDAEEIILSILEERPEDLFANATLIEYHVMHDEIPDAERAFEKIRPHVKRIAWLEEYLVEILDSSNVVP